MCIRDSIDSINWDNFIITANDEVYQNISSALAFQWVESHWEELDALCNECIAQMCIRDRSGSD